MQYYSSNMLVCTLCFPLARDGYAYNGEGSSGNNYDIVTRDHKKAGKHLVLV